MKKMIGLGLVLLLGSMPVLAADGPALFREHCARCHGDSGRADSWRGYLFFARNFSKARWQAAHTDADILEAIDQGPRIMPAYRDKLTLEERQALVQVVRGFGKP